MTFTDNNYAPEDKIYECDGCGEETTDVVEIDGKIYCEWCADQMCATHELEDEEELAQLF